MALTNSWPGVSGAATTTDARKALAGLLAKDASGNARAGVLPAHSNALVSSRADMNVDIAAFAAAAVQFGGPILIANDGVAQLPSVLVSPGSGTNYYVVYAKQNESTAPGTDANNNRVFGAQLSTTSFAVARAALPVGAVELGTVEMPTGKTATNQGGVVITATHQFTAAAGGDVWVRNATELAAWAPSQGATALRLDNRGRYERVGSSWLPIFIPEASFSPSFTNFIAGTSALSGWYQIDGSWCSGEARIDVNSGFSMNASGIQLNPPVTPADIVEAKPVGEVSFVNGGVGYYGGELIMATDGKLRLMYYTGSGTPAQGEINNSQPFGGWDASDWILVSFKFKV